MGTSHQSASGPEILRFRHHRARGVAGLIVTISLLTLVPVWPWFALLMIPPALWTGWVWRAGTDADRSGVRVRALLGQRRLRWADIEAITADSHGGTSALLTNGNQLPLTAVPAAELPRIAALAPHA